MPYRYELQNRERFRRAALSGVALALLLLLLILAPTRMLGWSGLGFGSLAVPEGAAVQEVAVERSTAAKVRPPVSIEHLTFPEYPEWSDLETPCADCDWTVGYGFGGPLDDVDSQALGSLERSSQLTAHASNGPSYGSRRSSAPAGFGGGGGAGGGGGGGGAGVGPASEASEALVETSAQANETNEAVEATTQTAATAAANAGSGGSSSSGSGSSGSDIGSDGDGSPGASSSDATETNLVLSPISPNAAEGTGIVSAAVTEAPQHVVQALAEAPVGAETVHTLGEPDAIDALLDLDEPTASVSNAEAVSELPAVSAEAAVVPEPASLLLMGLALSAILYRLRRVARP